MSARYVLSMLLAVAAASPALAASSATPWKAVATSGPVTARAEDASDPSWKKLARGERLAARSDVRTGRRGRATLTDEASVLMIDPASEVRLPAPGEPPRVVQAKGSVVYEVDGSKVRGFEVVTPFLVAGVKGTVFLVTVEERLAAVTVEHGVVAVRRGDSGVVVEVRAGETAVFDADGPAEIQIIRSGDAAASKDPEGSARAVRIAEREERRLDLSYAAGVDVASADALLTGASGALLDATDSLLDTGADLICSPIEAIEDPIRDILDPILDPPDDSSDGILDPTRDIINGLPIPRL
jgi:hypothetical protein